MIRNPLRTVVLVGLCSAGLPGMLHAHAVVFPKRSTPGAYEKYVLRVPNERDLPTTRVELVFPSGVRVVSFGDVPGWALQVVTDSAKHVTAAVWTGTLGVERFVEFPFVAVNPEGRADLVWPAYQTYASGEQVRWTGPEGSEHPASATAIRRVANPIGILAAALSILALVLSLFAAVRARRATEPRPA